MCIFYFNSSLELTFFGDQEAYKFTFNLGMG